LLGRIAVSALGISILSRNAIGEVQPRFGDKEKARFVSEHGRSFCQIKARRSQSPFEFQTYVRTQSTLWRWKNAEPSSGNVKKHARFHAGRQYQLGRTRKILSEHELLAHTQFAAARKRKRPPSEAAPEMLAPPSVVARGRSIQVPRTTAIGLTDAALNGPARLAAVPGSATVVVIAVMVAVIPIRGCWSRCADCDGADKP
jgi:hypothetical protein